MITKRQLGLAAPTAAKSGRLDLWYPFLVASMQKHGITTPARQQYFLANLLEETGEFQALEENLNYSAARLRQVFPSIFDGLANADATAAGGKQAIGNTIYGDEFRSPGYRMGNNYPGSGYRNRGRGPMQITGEDNYRAYFVSQGMDPDSDRDLLLQPAHGAESAAEFWVRAGCNACADAGNFTLAVEKVNGGTLNMSTRTNYLGRLVDAMNHPDPLPPLDGPDTFAHPEGPPSMFVGSSGDPPPPVTAEESKPKPVLEPVPPPPPVPPPNFEVKPNGNVVLSDIGKSTIVKKSRWIEKLGWAGGILTTISGGLQAFKNFFVQLFGGIEVTDTVVVCVTVVTVAVIIASVLVARSTGKDRIRMWLQGIA